MKAVSSRARKQLLPCEVFDLVSGTSTGGIIAILLGRLGLDCQTAIKVYKELTTAVCGSDEPTFYKAFFSAIEVGLDSKPYEATIANVVGKYAGHEDMTMAQDGVNLIDHKHTRVSIRKGIQKMEY
jgi:patatin-like phospholipase/acyl hydrolase